MVPDKIKKFYKTRDDFFKKKKEISREMFELDMLLHAANIDLKDTIDNGLDNNYLVEVSRAYSKHKFESKVVSDFIERIDNLLLKGIEPKLKDNLEVVSICIPIAAKFHAVEMESDLICGPISIDILDVSSNRFFKVVIPIQSSIKTDIVNWIDTGEGLYRVKARSTTSGQIKEICRVFDQSKVAEAVEKYLTGGFDDELDRDALDFTEFISRIPYHRDISSWNSAYDEYDTCVQYAEVSNSLFNSEWAIAPSYSVNSDIVQNCICDIEDYV